MTQRPEEITPWLALIIETAKRLRAEAHGEEQLKTFTYTSGPYQGNKPVQYFALARQEMVELTQNYINHLEKATTEEVCRCLWVTVEVEGKTMRRREADHPFCSIHSRQGFLLGFLEFLFPENPDARFEMSTPERLAKDDPTG